MHASTVHNLGLASLQRRPALEPDTIVVQLLGISTHGGTYAVVPWGPAEPRLVTKQPCTNGRHYRQPELTPDTYVECLNDDEMAGKMTEQNIAEAARLHAQAHGYRGNELLNLSRSLAFRLLSRRGVDVDPMRGLPSLSPVGAEGVQA